MQDPFDFADALGPEKIVHIHEPGSGLKAVLAVDNVATGPAIGGVRMAADATMEEAFRLARAMTLKNAAAGLRHGGGKSVIIADPKAPTERKESLVRAFARAIADIVDYIPGPDMGTDETSMAWMWDEIGRAVGLPEALGGIPLDEIGATGFGLAASVEAAHGHCGLELAGARVAVQGFGSVGTHAARFLAEKGCILVAASDSGGTALTPDGVDPEALIAHKQAGGSVATFPGATPADGDAVIGVDCDIWIPAARPDVITAGNVDRLKARLVVQGANIPVTAEAEARLHEKGILSIPDFIANAGGVICAAVEYAGGTRRVAFDTIDDTITANVGRILKMSDDRQVSPRAAAEAFARERVVEASGYRRRF